MVKIKFFELNKTDKALRVINIVFALGMAFSSFAMLAYYLIVGSDNSRIFPCIVMGLVFLAPFLIELIFRRRLSNAVLLIFNVFAFLSGFLGCVLNFYDKYIWFDIVIHVIFGYLSAFVGLFLILNLEKGKSKILTTLLFCLFAVFALELVWELLEWGMSNIFNMHVQGEIVPGTNAPLVTDTMIDILCNFSGGIIFAIHYLIGKCTKCKLGIEYMERELTVDKNLNKTNEDQQKNA